MTAKGRCVCAGLNPMHEVIYILIAAILPSLVLVYYIFRKDKYQREPVRQLLKAYGYGILSIFVALCIAAVGEAMSIEEPTSVPEAFWNAFVTAGIPEELAKFFCLWLFLRKNPYYDEYIDGIVYSVCLGMGFAAFENIGYLFAELDSWLETGILRGLLSVPGHFFFAVTMGYFYSKATFGDPHRKRINFFLALFIPILLHGLVDALLMSSDALGGSLSAILLFAGLWFYMFATSKKRIREHLDS